MKIEIQKDYQDNNDIKYRALLNGNQVGLVQACLGQIYDLEVVGRYRRRGIGTRLMQAVLEDFGHKELSLSAEPEGITLAQLQKFYKRFNIIFSFKIINC
jgi:ribosomal protein S18 acetylase RimI-like enzyme